MKISDADYQFSVTATPDLDDDTGDIHYVPASVPIGQATWHGAGT